MFSTSMLLSGQTCHCFWCGKGAKNLPSLAWIEILAASRLLQLAVQTQMDLDVSLTRNTHGLPNPYMTLGAALSCACLCWWDTGGLA